VRLFVDRARSVRPAFAADLARSGAVAEIVARLDGLPLAIELAAARTRLLTPEAMLPRLERRLDLLTVGGRDRPERQQTLRGAIAWSHDLLDPPEQRLFARLAVFAPSAAIDQIEAVCGPADELGRDVLDTLDGLVGHSLVRQIDAGGQVRFGMLATIREYAVECLDRGPDAESARDRHLAAYVELAETAGPRLTREGGREWLDRLEDEHDNMRAAFAWAGERGDGGSRLRLVAALWRFWQIRGHLAEGLARAETALAEEAATTDVIRLAALDAAGGLAYWVGNFARAVHWYQKALEVRRQMGGDAIIAEGMYNLAFPMAFGRIDVEEVPAVAGEALERYRRSGDEGGEAKALWLLANVEDEGGDTAAARRYGLEALPILERLGDRFLLGWCLFTIGQLDARDGDLDAAMERLRPALQEFSSVGDQSGLVLVLDTMAAVASRGNDRVRAARLAGAVARLEGTTGTGLNQWTRRRVGWDPAGLRDDPATAPAWRAGEADDDRTIVDFALGTMRE
jgi:tetratricopeptide (TPR) repeat protein